MFNDHTCSIRYLSIKLGLNTQPQFLKMPITSMLQLIRCQTILPLKLLTWSFFIKLFWFVPQILKKVLHYILLSVQLTISVTSCNNTTSRRNIVMFHSWSRPEEIKSEHFGDVYYNAIRLMWAREFKGVAWD